MVLVYLCFQNITFSFLLPFAKKITCKSDDLHVSAKTLLKTSC